MKVKYKIGEHSFTLQTIVLVLIKFPEKCRIISLLLSQVLHPHILSTV